MFSYCGNNPANRADPTGNAFVQVAYNFDSVSNSMFLILGGGGGGTAYALTCASMCARPIKEFKDKVNCSNEAEVQRNLQKNGMAFYKGVPVFLMELPFDKSAASIGIIVMDDYYGTASAKTFSDVLKHERGHVTHLNQIGVPAYVATVAIPSLIGAGLSYVNPFIKKHYESLPWENIAEQLGGVNGEYLPGATTVGTIYWVFTLLVSLAC